MRAHHVREASVGRSRRAALFLLPLLGGTLLSSCGALVGEDAEVGGETHFLVSCEGGCGPRLSCIGGACTQRCEPGGSSCAALSSQASCVDVTASAIEVSPLAGKCDVQCGADADCASLGAEYSCRSGACRAAPEGSETRSMSAPLVRAVDTETCRSALLWVGEDRPSAEMRPGSDCVGCHRETGALPLFIAGTVYPVRSENTEDCLGIEGVEVVVTDAAGRERRTFTNRAGNFYFEGADSDLELPYTATIHWRSEGNAITSPMGTTPSYGGCAFCHSNAAVGTLDGVSLPPAPQDVIPTDPIFTPGLYRE